MSNVDKAQDPIPYVVGELVCFHALAHSSPHFLPRICDTTFEVRVADLCGGKVALELKKKKGTRIILGHTVIKVVP